MTLCAFPCTACFSQNKPLLVRPADDRPRRDPAELKPQGIEIFQSRRLRLFTDVPAEDAKPLPELANQAFEDLEKYFGKLPPAEDGSDFQVNAYLIKDKEAFTKLGLLKDELQESLHGRQKGYEIWLMEQPHEYYRRHLLLHEFTHAYMLAIPQFNVPVAYLEGMAELFGTHHPGTKNRYELGVVPRNRSDYRGHDRLFLMRRDVAARPIPLPLDIAQWPNANFRLFNESYAWAWGTCLFFDKHPRTRDRFHKFAQSLSSSTWNDFEEQLKPDLSEIMTEWQLFASEAWEGFDFDRMAIEFRDGTPLSELNAVVKGKPFSIAIHADQGWQSSGVLVEKGRSYSLTATGQFTLADKPKPWISEAEGITFRYHNSRPLGRLLAAIRIPEPAEDAPESMLKTTSLGATGRLEAAVTGTLYLRLNDHPAELADNTGQVNVEIRFAE